MNAKQHRKVVKGKIYPKQQLIPHLRRMSVRCARTRDKFWGALKWHAAPQEIRQGKHTGKRQKKTDEKWFS